MSFFNSLQEYVSNSVAGLSLSTKRLSFSRSESKDDAATSSKTQEISEKGTAGFPRILPHRSVSSSIESRRSTLDTIIPMTPVRHPSAKSIRSPKKVLDFRRSFCSRRPSWPNIDHQASSGVQDSDGLFFENCTALTFKHDEAIERAIFKAEKGNCKAPSTDVEVGITSIDYVAPDNEKDKLYIEMLYTIINSVGVSQAENQYFHYREDLLQYGQRAFEVPLEKHYQMLQLADEEQPPILVLSVQVLEAENLEAKDANGFSDPYCMLGIQPLATAISPQPSAAATPTLGSSTNRSGLNSSSMPGSFGDNTHEKLRKHHSFRLSFKRKEVKSREQRDSLTGALPAKVIRATSVKSHTLNPKWNEKFRFDIDDINNDLLHLDIWDHDDESSVLEAVSKLNEVRGVRGLGRYFKQVCQSARQTSQDDFLGCITIPINEIPSTGLDGWFKLEARSQRSTVQGRIKLKLSLSTRENRNCNDEDNWAEMIQYECLYTVFVDFELRNSRHETWTWNGDLSNHAKSILHQHAIQGDLTDLQIAIAQFAAASKIYLKHSLDPRWIYKLLTNIEKIWRHCTLNKEEEMWLAEKFTAIEDRWLQQLRHHRQLFPSQDPAYLSRLENILRCLAYMSNMESFWKCCPFNKEIRSEIVASLRKGTPEWYSQLKTQFYDTSENSLKVAEFLFEIYVYCHRGLLFYHRLFESINGIPYFSVTFKQIDRLVSENVITFLNETGTLVEDDIQVIFPVYLWVKDLALFHTRLPSGGDHKLNLLRSSEWFEPFFSHWLTISKVKALQRVRASAEVQKICDNTKFVKHTSSCVDVVSIFCQLRDFWIYLQWPMIHCFALLSQLLECICSGALLYADLEFQALTDLGYFAKEDNSELRDVMCVTLNNLEYVYNFVTHLENYFHLADLEKFDTEAQKCLLSAVHSTSAQFNSTIADIIKRLGPQMQSDIRKAMFHLAWSPDTLPSHEAIQPLLECLHTQFSTLNLALLQINFERVLTVVWEQILLEIKDQIEGSIHNSDTPIKFYERFYETLHILCDFFNSEGMGLSYDSMHTIMYCEIEQLIQHHRTDTESLIEDFYRQRLQDQLNCTSSQYGVLTVRAYFNHESLCVEVLHAKDIIPLDPNGFSDPFVILELLPHRVFPKCTEQRTNVHKRTLHPVFDECFEFTVSIDQCRAIGAMIAFTVMDHDVLTANDFAGEAFLALSTIAGVSDSTGVDNFHGLKSIDLTLMHQNKNHPIIQILDSRLNDRLASEFIRRQKPRFEMK